jgi:hypothetical protein
MTYNAAERRDVRRREKESRQREVQRREIITSIMSLAPSRAWICDILEVCHVFASSFSTDPGQMAFAEGERNVGLRLLGDIMLHCPDKYILMMQERNQKEIIDGTRRSRDSADGDGSDSGDTRATGYDSDDDTD